MAKQNLTLDYILGLNNGNLSHIDANNIDANNANNVNNANNANNANNLNNLNNLNKLKNKTKNNKNNNDKTSQNNTNDLNNNIDNILNKGLVKFENKIQTSMFFVCYKEIIAFCNDYKKIYNDTIPIEFIDNHIKNILPNIIKEYTGNLKKRCKKTINLEMICLGRKLDNKQCTRKKHNDSDFCKSHFIKLSNGRIDQPTKINIRNKRGRKRKVDFDPRQYDNDYITLWEDIINGEKVLVDSNNNIFTFDLETPQYIGKKQIDNKLDILAILTKINEQKQNIINEQNIADIPIDIPIDISIDIPNDIPIDIPNDIPNDINIIENLELNLDKIELNIPTSTNKIKKTKNIKSIKNAIKNE